MLFKHDSIVKKNGVYSIPKLVNVKTNAVLDKAIFKELWHNFSFGSSEIDIDNVADISFSVGNADKLSCENNAYAINVTPQGIALTAKNEKNLIYAYLTLLDLISAMDEGESVIHCCEIYESPYIENRMIHFCVFPETELWEIDRFVRMCGVMKYTHIVIEFWGMLKYDCLKELAWENAFTKEQIRPIIKTANELGVEIIPMFNHWGHAAQSRVACGKHTVLEQNPNLAYLFTDGGWCWNVKNSKTRELLKSIRAELLELCGKGSYFHIGCDEAYGFSYSPSEIEDITQFINETAEELDALGRKTIMWADMLIYTKIPNTYGTAPNEQCCETIKNILGKNVITADWQYNCTDFPVETSQMLQKSGFDVILCPWSQVYKNTNACLETVKTSGLYGIMHTTWHTLSTGTMHIGKVADACWSKNYTLNEPTHYMVKTAEFIRKVYPSGGIYEKSGWVKYQTGDFLL